MKATDATVVYLVAPRRIELRTETLSEPGHDDLLCETLMSAISPGTELAAYTGAPPLRDGVAYPRLQGYCNVARVLAAGAGAADGYSPGDRILSFSSHRSHFLLPARDALLRLPVHARSCDIACAYLFHLGYNAVLRADVRAGSRVLVVGVGVLGLATVAMASLAGATVFALSDQPGPSDIARTFGATAVHRRSELPALRAALGEGLADVVVTTTNTWDDWDVALHLAGRRATIATLGFPGRGQPPGDYNPLDSRHFYAKQLRIESVGMSPERPDDRGFARFNERDNLKVLVDLIGAGRLQPSRLVSGTFPGMDIQRAYDDLLARRGSPITYLLSWNPE